MTDSYLEPGSDVSPDGIPEYADDESTAWERTPSTREADGPSPAALPPDRDSGPFALDEYGTTPEEQRRGEPLSARLAREEPDVSPDAIGGGADVPTALAEEATDQVAAGQVVEDGAALDDTPVEAHLDSPVSMYDRPDRE